MATIREVSPPGGAESAFDTLAASPEKEIAEQR